MNDMTSLDIDFDALSDSELDNLSIDGLLGVNIADVRLSNTLPTGTYLFEPQKIAKRTKVADVGANKKARVMIELQLRVVKCLVLEDGALDTTDFDGKFHTAGFNIASERGRRELALFAVLILGINPRDRKTIEALGRDLSSVLNEIIEEKLTFGAMMTYKEADGFENCNFNFRPDKFISAEQAVEYLD
jgi:hypothetical protein